MQLWMWLTIGLGALVILVAIFSEFMNSDPYPRKRKEGGFFDTVGDAFESIGDAIGDSFGGDSGDCGGGDGGGD